MRQKHPLRPDPGAVHRADGREPLVQFDTVSSTGLVTTLLNIFLELFQIKIDKDIVDRFGADLGFKDRAVFDGEVVVVDLVKHFSFLNRIQVLLGPVKPRLDLFFLLGTTG